jgi:hypothetical protein
VDLPRLRRDVVHSSAIDKLGGVRMRAYDGSTDSFPDTSSGGKPSGSTFGYVVGFLVLVWLSLMVLPYETVMWGLVLLAVAVIVAQAPTIAGWKI